LQTVRRLLDHGISDEEHERFCACDRSKPDVYCGLALRAVRKGQDIVSEEYVLDRVLEVEGFAQVLAKIQHEPKRRDVYVPNELLDVVHAEVPYIHEAC
jgi:hypothetical protein